MASRTPAKPANGIKRERFLPTPVKDDASARPAKKAKLLDDSDDESDHDDGGVELKVNDEYAKRYEFNNKRAEKHRLEEKYGKGPPKKYDDEDEEDSDEEDEDDAGELATEELDAEWRAALQAIVTKDPRVYDKNVNFYRPIDEESHETTGKKPKEMTMTLRDYHTKNLLEGNVGGEDEESAPVKTYAQEQEDARQLLVKELQAAVASSDDEDDFMVAKPNPQTTTKGKAKITQKDVDNADKDPETFLSNFMASRAWVPTGDVRWQPLESDDDEEDTRAEDFESAYNMYFEDSVGTNEKIVTYARDAVASTTVRRNETSTRHNAREAARAKREAEQKQREEDLARLKKLKVDEMEEKVKMIRKTAGLSGKDFKMDDWVDVLEADWSDDKWEAEMQKRFGDAYYDGELEASDSDDDENKKGKKKLKKPKFDDDIDIGDLIPDFDDKELENPTATLTDDGDDDDDAESGADDDVEMDDADSIQPNKKSSKHRKQERADAKASARRDRRLIENLVSSNLEYEASLVKSKGPTKFRYRETSPTTFGLTPRDILLADDKQLNEFAGLKKMATFRDPAKKKKDKKFLSKKARVKQWRVDTFGDEEGPKGGFELLLGNGEGAEETAGEGKHWRDQKSDVNQMEVNGGLDIREGGDGKGKKKRKRKGKGKGGAVEA
ncbi:Krr1-domain-containing protein [Amniculicola lignicola CBS 123094]|uniref:Krr1-domain-containing protein n=1 Tax=Amniculicola lignicola CBS 123094 TaxID=1392246 RepID=A0A6A5WWZ4_9PLEO|nr:Krr1-domain-containing protein [Amniculicola lignicola CBS 123094]